MYNNFKHSDITEKVLKAFFNVYNKLGYGFLEKVYERALILELGNFDLQCENQYPITVFYEGENIGDYFADLLIENKVIVELKAVSQILPIHEVQVVHYLKATEIEVGLLLNFGEKPQFKRKVFSSRYKNHNQS